MPPLAAAPLLLLLLLQHGPPPVTGEEANRSAVARAPNGTAPANVSRAIQSVPKAAPAAEREPGAVAHTHFGTNCTDRPLQASQMYMYLSPFWYKAMALITTIGLLVSLTSNMIIIYLFAW